MRAAGSGCGSRLQTFHTPNRFRADLFQLTLVGSGVTTYGPINVNASCTLQGIPIADANGVITLSTQTVNLPIFLPATFSSGLVNFNGTASDVALVSQSILQVSSSEYTQHCAFGAQGSGVGSVMSGTFTLVNAAPTVVLPFPAANGNWQARGGDGGGRGSLSAHD